MTTDEPISRREFLRIVGAAGAAVGLGAGLGGLLAACNKAGVTTNTMATIAAGQTTSATNESTTTSATPGPETGRPLRIGLVSARTGSLALFGKADDWWTAFGLAAVPEGVLCGDGKLRTITILSEDCRSDPAVAAQVAAHLITDGRVDIILCSADSGIVNAVAGQAETLQCPCLSDFVQWRSLVFDRGGAPDKPFKWTYAHAIGLEDVAANYVAMWDRVATNRKVGLIFADDPNGRLWADASTGLSPITTAAGYECFLSGLYPVGAEDFTAYVDDFKKNGYEICCGAMTTAEFIAFWEQARKRGYKPKVVTMGGALLFPQALEAAGSSARNATAECVWHPTWPYSDSISGKTAQNLADDYENATGGEWTAAIAQYAKFEWAVDVFKRTRSLLDKEDVIARVRTTRLETCVGPLDFTAAVDMTDLNASKRPVENVYKAPVGGMQWVTGSTFAFEPTMVTAANNHELPVPGTIKPMTY